MCFIILHTTLNYSMSKKQIQAAGPAIYPSLQKAIGSAVTRLKRL